MNGATDNIKTFDIENDTVEEIISILAKNGRPDLIKVLRQSRDDDYKPKIRKTKEYYEYYEDYKSDDRPTTQDVSIDAEGFWSLK
jgi:hypothetical protein